MERVNVLKKKREGMVYTVHNKTKSHFAKPRQNEKKTVIGVEGLYSLGI